MIIAICIVVSLVIGWWLGYSYFLIKACTGCRSIPSSHNSAMVAICDMWEREGDLCPVCPNDIKCGVAPCEIYRKHVEELDNYTQQVYTALCPACNDTGIVNHGVDGLSRCSCPAGER